MSTKGFFIESVCKKLTKIQIKHKIWEKVKRHGR